MNFSSSIKKNNQGFTLIEALVAMFVLVIGIFSLYTMQLVAIDGNSVSRFKTVASNWAADKIEEIINSPYDDLVDGTRSPENNNGTNQDTDGGGDGVDDDGDDFGLNDTVAADGTIVADGDAVSPDGVYRFFWNVAVDHPVDDLKMIRILVQYDYRGTLKTVVMDYIKPKM